MNSNPPAYIANVLVLAAGEDGYWVDFYLADQKGGFTTSDGTATIRIFRNGCYNIPEFCMFNRSYTVKKSDFVTEKDAIKCRLGRIFKSQLAQSPYKYRDDCYSEGSVRFDFCTADGTQLKSYGIGRENEFVD
jgi:hypothetical protein